MASKTCDAIVIGSGPGGYVCAIRLGQLDQKVICVEKEPTLGGVCLNWGCIPSKALISVAHTLDKARHGATMGIKTSDIHLDVDAMQDWKEGIVRKLTGGVGMLFKTNSVETARGSARLIDRKTVEVTSDDGTKQTLEARKAIVIATGATTIELPSFPFDGKQIIGAREAVSLRSIPKRLCVIGGGVIGLELGAVYQKFGSELTIIEALPQLLTGVEPDCAQVVERKLVRLGAKVFKNAKATGYKRESDGSLLVQVQVDGKNENVACDVLLVAVGMRPNARELGVEAAGVHVGPAGNIPTDAQGRTNVEGLYAIGDVTGAPLLAHKASKEGEVVAEVIAGRKAAKDWAAIPAAVFTDPEIASAGLTTEQAQAAGHQVKAGRFPFSALGRAMALGETDGFVKVLLDARTKRLLGMHVVGPSASELVAEATLALEMGAFGQDLSLTIHTHPTLPEAVMEAAAAALGHAIHIANRP